MPDVFDRESTAMWCARPLPRAVSLDAFRARVPGADAAAVRRAYFDVPDSAPLSEYGVAAAALSAALAAPPQPRRPATGNVTTAVRGVLDHRANDFSEETSAWRMLD